MASAKKKARSSHVKDECFDEEIFKSLIQRNHPRNYGMSIFCLVCDKRVNVEHQGRTDLVKNCGGQTHKDKAKAARTQEPIDQS